MKKKLIIAGVIAAVVALGYFKQSGNSDAISVNIAAAKVEEIKTSILASGTLIYKDQVQLRSEVIGQVSELFIEEGDNVSQGQVLMRLDQRSFNADVEQQQAFVRMQTIAIERQKKQLDNTKAKWLRNKNLYERKMIGQDAFELIDNQHDLAKIDLRSRQEALTQAQATLDKALERLEKTVFRSPIDGIATSVDIKIGETAISGTTNIAGSNLITIADPASILVEVQVDEADIANVRLDQDVDVYAVAFPDDALKGQVKTIATSAKRASNREGLSFTVKILLESDENIDITCKPRNPKNLKIISSRLQEKQVFKKNMNFQELGIGGLDAEFNEIFRRAFNSRRFPPSVIEKYGYKHVKGMLLYGPPGTGKTLIARKIADALNCEKP